MSFEGIWEYRDDWNKNRYFFSVEKITENIHGLTSFKYLFKDIDSKEVTEHTHIPLNYKRIDCNVGEEQPDQKRELSFSLSENRFYGYHQFQNTRPYRIIFPTEYDCTWDMAYVTVSNTTSALTESERRRLYGV